MILRIEAPETVKLLFAFWRLVPDEERKQGTLEEKLAAGQSPVGSPCPRCGSGRWVTSGHYGPMLTCTNTTCGYSKGMTPRDATDLARVMGLMCGACGCQVQGRKHYQGIFLGCTAYPKCTWTTSLETLV